MLRPLQDKKFRIFTNKSFTTDKTNNIRSGYDAELIYHPYLKTCSPSKNILAIVTACFQLYLLFLKFIILNNRLERY